jgi:hypothetical protein
VTAILTYTATVNGQLETNVLTETVNLDTIAVLTETTRITPTINGTPTAVDFTGTVFAGDPAVPATTEFSTIFGSIVTTVQGVPATIGVTGVYKVIPPIVLNLFTTTVGGVELVMTFTQTITIPSTLTTSSSTSLPPTGTALTTAPTTTPTTTPSPIVNRAWIAGPVIGGLAGLAIILFLAWWISRRRQKKKSEFDNTPELRGDTTVDPELHGNALPSEAGIDGDWTVPMDSTEYKPKEQSLPYELPANHVPMSKP